MPRGPPRRDVPPTRGIQLPPDHQEREVRAARNQASFRALNEKLEALNETFASVTETFTIACECADPLCVEMVDTRSEDDEAVHAEPRHFVVLPGHLWPGVERVVEQRDGLVVVETSGTAAGVAAILDREER